MKRALLILILSAFIGFNCFAQLSDKGSKFNLGLETAIPFGKNSIGFKTGIGGSLKYEYRADSNFYLTISAGYISFPLTDAAKQELIEAGFPTKSAFGYIPIKIGGKFFIVKGLFGELQLGNAFGTNINRSDSASASIFTFSPGIGYAFNKGFELGARYEGWFTNGLLDQYVFRLAYRFKL